MPPGADTASSWPPSGRSWARSTRTTPTSSSQRWTPQPTRSKRSKSTASPPSSSSLQETRTRWAVLFARSTSLRRYQLIWEGCFSRRLKRSPAIFSTVTIRFALLLARICALQRLCIHSLCPPPDSRVSLVLLDLAASTVSRNLTLPAPATVGAVASYRFLLDDFTRT